jgi:hypothetical protein
MARFRPSELPRSYRNRVGRLRRPVWKSKGRSNAEPGLWAQDHKTVKSVMESASNQNVSIGEPMYRRIVEAVPEGTWVVAQGLTIFSKRRMAEILG